VSEGVTRLVSREPLLLSVRAPATPGENLCLDGVLCTVCAKSEYLGEEKGRKVFRPVFKWLQLEISHDAVFEIKISVSTERV
jgi:hypothetical protein